MARLRPHKASGYRVVLIDDSQELLTSTARLLRLEGHEVKTAAGIDEGVELVETHRPHCVLVDYYLDGGRIGEEAVERIRRFDRATQIVLMTGYAGDVPAREFLKRIEIEGYHDKSDGPDKLLLWVDVAIRSYERTRLLRRRAWAMRHVLDAGHTLHRIQPAEGLFSGALRHVLELVAGPRGRPDGDGLVLTYEEGAPMIRAGSGRFGGTLEPSQLDAATRALVERTLEEGRQVCSDGAIAVPMRSAGRTTGCMLASASADLEAIAEPLQLFANQVAAAVNLELYALATVDGLTGLVSRRYFTSRLVEQLKLAAREGQGLSVVVADVDHFKGINDTHGHAGGDRALAHVGAMVSQAKRDTDLAGRIGGEEIALILPHTAPKGAGVMAGRLRRAIEKAPMALAGVPLSLTLSMGFAGTEAVNLSRAQQRGLDAAGWEALARTFVDCADRAMYRAKADGRNRVAPYDGDLGNLLARRADALATGGERSSDAWPARTAAS